MAVGEMMFRPPRCFLRPEWKEIQKLLLYMCLHSCNFKTLLLLPGEQCSLMLTQSQSSPEEDSHLNKAGVNL